MEEASVSSHFPEQIVSKDFQIVLMSFCAFFEKKTSYPVYLFSFSSLGCRLSEPRQEGSLRAARVRTSPFFCEPKPSFAINIKLGSAKGVGNYPLSLFSLSNSISTTTKNEPCQASKQARGLS